MLPINLERVRAEAARLAEGGRANAEAKLLEWAKNHPTLPCTHCAGQGAYTETADGTRRPFDHHDFHPSKGDAYVGSCPLCRGFGRVTVTIEEAERHQARALAAQRARYRAIAKSVCRERGITSVKFEELARRRLASAAPTPAQWLEAATLLARDFGVTL